MSNLFFTSDLHFFHAKVVEYSNRPWTAENQTEEIIRRWNSRVSDGDIVYSLGDFAFTKDTQYNKVAEVIRELKGDIHFIRGNHCQRRLWENIRGLNLPNLKSIQDYKEITVDKTKICMMHYPLTYWNRRHYGSLMLHGHLHGNFQGEGKILDVGIDNHPDRQIYSYEEVKEFMDSREVPPSHHGRF